MSNYNSTNTHILATHEQAGGNTRMLLFHVCESGRHEYVVGSYFTVETNVGDPFDMDGPAFIDEYSWDWGHYFNDGYGNDGSGIVNAVDYWKREVLDAEPFEGFEVNAAE